MHKKATCEPGCFFLFAFVSGLAGSAVDSLVLLEMESEPEIKGLSAGYLASIVPETVSEVGPLLQW
jgi:hypothetical protein